MHAAETASQPGLTHAALADTTSPEGLRPGSADAAGGLPSALPAAVPPTLQPTLPPTLPVTPPPGDALSVVLDYHERTKHRLQRYAAGPETLDWDAQPDPFRRYAGAMLEPLPLAADAEPLPWSQLFDPGAVPPRAFSRAAVGLLLELSFALAAWKQSGPDRWAVRCNPSSGNLHPTEAYVLTRGASGLADGLYHYAPREHGLERRCTLPDSAAHRTADDQAPRLFLGLSSIHWREAWKYGERAFRYCQLDVGHALGALRYAAAVLGWTLRPVPMPAARLAHLMGLDREADFGAAEREDPDMLIELINTAQAPLPCDPGNWTEGAEWAGVANRLDRHPMYRWPVIDAVARATAPSAASVLSALAPDTRCPPQCASRVAGCSSAVADAALAPPRPPIPGLLWARPASALIRGRRSAQRFDRRESQTAASFFRMLGALLPESGLPWDAWPFGAHLHPVVFVHRVEGLTPGAYALPRSAAAEKALRVALSPELKWEAVPGAPEDLPLYLLAENPGLAGTLRTLCCHQALGSDATFAVAFLAEFTPVLEPAPWRYRELLQEAGLLGHVLYLHAEAEGLRGTGIGCYFDDSVHELLGLRDRHFQSLYHFTVGVPVTDTRIGTDPPYPQRVGDGSTER